MRLADATSIPNGIKTFPRGEGAEVSALESILNQLVERIEILEKNHAAEIQKLKEKNALLESILAGRDGKLVVLETPKTVRPPAKEDANQIAILDQKIVELEANQAIQEARHAQKMVELEANQTQKMVELQAEHDQDLERLALEAAYDRKRVTKLEQNVQPLQKDRGEVLRALIAASGGKVLSKYARLKMHLDKATFSRLLNTLSDYVARKVHQPDRRQKLLVLVDL